MSDNFSQEPLLDMYIFETTQLIEQLEQIIINNEKSGCFKEDAINEVFRIMHTIKGSSAMMTFDNITTVAHSMEDLFFFIRENERINVDCSKLSDIVLNGIDFAKAEVSKVIDKKKPDGDASLLISDINNFLSELKQSNEILCNKETRERVIQTVNEPKNFINLVAYDVSKENEFKSIIYFEEGCEMEDIRAFSIIQDLKDLVEEVHHVPEEVFENENCIDIIRKDGFKIFFKTCKDYEEINKFFMNLALIRDFELIQVKDSEKFDQLYKDEQIHIDESSVKVPKIQGKYIGDSKKVEQSTNSHHSIISVNVDKLDKLMNIVGELVISEAMVIQNPDLKGLTIDNFQKAARQLQKITSELQDVVMSIRMVPLAATFKKMNRIVRDMSKKLSKEVRLEIIGEDTEVDKNIIEHISDPIIHLVRNSIDHGLETPEVRMAKGKSKIGTVTLEAKNEGSDVFIIIKDDGKGLNREKILAKAKENGLINKPENEISDKEVFSYIFLPGFSTNSEVTEYSGRGVGMDVVTKNISAVGGNVSIDSIPNKGTTITLKIPLTLAIMDGMTIRVGESTYTLPLISIKESFKPKEEDIITDPDGNKMIMIRGECYPILKLHELYKVKTKVTDIQDGIMLMINNEGKNICIFADKLIGEQQVVVKALPEYIKKLNKARGLSGCTLLGDGSISLILDVSELVNY
ncbi:chemotaxis protein CheA [Clostridium sp. BSD9I1]|uniref:chemotaxis protein CheA n=1 Tax=Clostridium sp. BSD9I1 TaxID=2003589 RepID=UPI0016485978|nr:chemotaxis protein CheA [Clostridium sp. BSD9I1]